MHIHIHIDDDEVDYEPDFEEAAEEDKHLLEVSKSKLDSLDESVSHLVYITCIFLTLNIIYITLYISCLQSIIFILYIIINYLPTKCFIILYISSLQNINLYYRDTFFFLHSLWEVM